MRPVSHVFIGALVACEALGKIVITYPTADTVWRYYEERTVTWTSDSSDVVDLTPEITGTTDGIVWHGAHIPTDGGEWNLFIGDNLQLGSAQIRLFNGSDSSTIVLARSPWFKLLPAVNSTSAGSSSSVSSTSLSSSALASASSTASFTSSTTPGPSSSSSHSFNSASPTTSPPPTSSKSPSNVGAIVGGVVGGVFALSIFALLFWFLFRRRRSRQPTADPFDGSTRVGSMKARQKILAASVMSQPMKLYNPDDPSTFPPPLEKPYEEPTFARPRGYQGYAEPA